MICAMTAYMPTDLLLEGITMVVMCLVHVERDMLPAVYLGHTLNYSVGCAVTVCMAADLLSEGITVISMCPGHVRTDMGGEKGECEAPESIAGQLKVFDSMSINDTGKFFNFEGKTVPY